MTHIDIHDVYHVAAHNIGGLGSPVQLDVTDHNGVVVEVVLYLGGHPLLAQALAQAINDVFKGIPDPNDPQEPA
jgi:hypothetical protein